MSKVSAYLQGHINGEVRTRLDERTAAEHDQSVLEQKPEMVAYPRTTNDLRKLTRFSWQLAEKGHKLPIHIRGAATSTTGASLGKGIVVDTSRYMRRVYEYEPKQKLARMQPGVSVETLDSALALQGVSIPPLLGLCGTVGGAVAEDAAGPFAGRYGATREYVSQLEVVLDSGDLIQTSRINKRELNRRKGLQTREGDIYRGIDTILEDHAEYIAKGAREGRTDRSGYPGIFNVRDKHGAVDLTPLFIGSQGTLGLISEMIVRAEFIPSQHGTVVVLIEEKDAVSEVLTTLARQEPASLRYFGAEYLHAAIEQGNTYEWLSDDIGSIQGLALVRFDDFNQRAREKRMKKLEKVCAKLVCSVRVLKDEADIEHGVALDGLERFLASPVEHADHVAPSIIDSAYVPLDQLDDFIKGVSDLSAGLDIPVAIEGSVLLGTYSVRPTISLRRALDKQKLFKLVDQVNIMLDGLGGSLVGGGGEGRTLSRFVRATWDDEYKQIVSEIKQVFDPHGVFNPGTKADVELRDLALNLRSDNGIGVI